MRSTTAQQAIASIFCEPLQKISLAHRSGRVTTKIHGVAGANHFFVKPIDELIHTDRDNFKIGSSVVSDIPKSKDRSLNGLSISRREAPMRGVVNVTLLPDFSLPIPGGPPVCS